MKYILISALTLVLTASGFAQDSTSARLKIGGGAGYSERIFKESKYPYTHYDPGRSFTFDVQYQFTENLYSAIVFHHTEHGIDLYDMGLKYSVDNLSLQVGFLQPLFGDLAVSADIGPGIFRGKYPDYEYIVYHDDDPGYDLDAAKSEAPALTVSGNANIALNCEMFNFITLQLGARYAISKPVWNVDHQQYSYTGVSQPHYGPSGTFEVDRIYQYLDYVLLIQFTIF